MFEYGLETGGLDTTVEHFVEWLAEWGRDLRRHLCTHRYPAPWCGRSDCI